MDVDKILENAKQILEKNWNGRFTIPSPTLYLHQWSWDSGFIAIGNSYYDVEHAIKEIDAQWKNGMVQRMPFTDWEYNRFIYLIELLKKYDYDQKKIYQSFPFKIKDVVFSSILYVANKYMIKIANIIGEEEDDT